LEEVPHEFFVGMLFEKSTPTPPQKPFNYWTCFANHEAPRSAACCGNEVLLTTWRRNEGEPLKRHPLKLPRETF